MFSDIHEEEYIPVCGDIHEVGYIYGDIYEAEYICGEW